MSQIEKIVPTHPNDIARRHGIRPGYQLIDYLEVGLPVFVIPIEAIVIASKPLGLVDEFLLRSIKENINTLETLSGFLGLDEVFVKKRLGELMTEDLIGYAPGQGGTGVAELTTKGFEAVKNVMLVQPKRESFVLAIDGITRQPLAVRRDRLLRGVDVRSYGIKEIRAFPDDNAPEFDDLAVMDLTQAVTQGGKNEKNIQKVMSLVSIGKRVRHFQEATMLIFRSEQGREIHVEFFIDGRPHKQITDAFARHDGVKSLHILEQVEEFALLAKDAVAEILPEALTEKANQVAPSARAVIRPIVAKVGNLESQIEEKEFAILDTDSRAEIERLNKEIEAIKQEQKKLEVDLAAIDVRHMEVHEHRPLFLRSLEKAEFRLLIVSPWIRDSVLTHDRLQKIRALVDRGVEVYIGYGIGNDDKAGWDKGQNAIKFLSDLAHKKQNFHFLDFGDTHAKILLVDDKYVVIGSFNWFSFEGNRRGFREEMSVYINVKAEIEKLFRRFEQRFH